MTRMHDGDARLQDGDASAAVEQDDSPSRWTFLSNHTHVLLCLAIDGDVRVRDVAERVGITERAVQRILGELEGAGTIERERVGRRNRYTINLDRPLRHPLEAHHTVGELLELLLPPESPLLRGLKRRAQARRRSG